MTLLLAIAVYVAGAQGAWATTAGLTTLVHRFRPEARASVAFSSNGLLATANVAADSVSVHSVARGMARPALRSLPRVELVNQRGYRR